MILKYYSPKTSQQTRLSDNEKEEKKDHSNLSCKSSVSVSKRDHSVEKDSEVENSFGTTSQHKWLLF